MADTDPKPLVQKTPKELAELAQHGPAHTSMVEDELARRKRDLAAKGSLTGVVEPL